MGEFENKVVVITGENICIDGGQTRLMIYHGDHGWSLEPKWQPTAPFPMYGERGGSICRNCMQIPLRN